MAISRAYKIFKVQGIEYYGAIDCWTKLVLNKVVSVKIPDRSDDFKRVEKPNVMASESVGVYNGENLLGFAPDDVAHDLYPYLIANSDKSCDRYKCRIIGKEDVRFIKSLTIRIDIECTVSAGNSTVNKK